MNLIFSVYISNVLHPLCNIHCVLTKWNRRYESYALNDQTDKKGCPEHPRISSITEKLELVKMKVMEQNRVIAYTSILT